MTINPSFSRRRPKRDIDSILDRAHRRWSSDEHILPPDFLHGSWAVGDSVSWLDGHPRNIAHPVGEGNLHVVTSVTADSGFVSLHQRVVTTLEGLNLDLVVSHDEECAWYYDRIEALELEHLGALRDQDRDTSSIESVKTNAMLDALTLIGLHTLHLDSVNGFRFAA